MNALVSQITSPVRPEPMPIIVDGAKLWIVAARWYQWRGSAPKIVINVVRHFLGTIRLADTAAWLVALAARNENLAQVAGLHPFHHLRDTFAARAALRSRLAKLV